MRGLLSLAIACALAALAHFVNAEGEADSLAAAVQAKIAANLAEAEERHKHKTKPKGAGVCVNTQNQFNAAVGDLYNTTTDVYDYVIANSLKTPKCPSDPSNCAYPDASTPPLTLVTVFTSLQETNPSAPGLTQLYTEGDADITIMDKQVRDCTAL